MDDIPPDVARRDIHAYVSMELEGLSDFGNTEFAVLAELADVFSCLRFQDVVTARPLGEPLRGHTGGINSVRFHRTGLARCPAHQITLSGCGMQRHVSHLERPCKGAPVRLTQSYSKPTGL